MLALLTLRCHFLVNFSWFRDVVAAIHEKWESASGTSGSLHGQCHTTVNVDESALQKPQDGLHVSLVVSDSKSRAEEKEKSGEA